MDTSLPPTYIQDFHQKESVEKFKYTKLGRTDLILSNFSLGGTAFGQAWGPLSSEVALSILDTGLRAGINYIDTAPWYGHGKSEKLLGELLKHFPRKAFYIATKVGRYEPSTPTMFDFSRATVLEQFENSLKALQMEFVDLIQIHDVEFCHSIDQIINHTLPALLELKAQGKARYVGITGYNLNVLKRIVALAPPRSIDTVLSYGRMTLQNRDLSDYMSFFEQHGLGVIDAAPLGMGILTHERYPVWHPASEDIKTICTKAAAYCEDKRHCLAHLAIKWAFHRPEGVTHVCSVTSVELLQANILCAQEPLTSEESALIEELDELFFRRMLCAHWENIEVAKYWTKMSKGEWEQNTD